MMNVIYSKKIRKIPNFVNCSRFECTGIASTANFGAFIKAVQGNPLEITSSNALDLARITCNKNMIPFDPEKPFVTSGIRVGTPAVTTRGLKEPEMVRIADFIERGVAMREDEAALRSLGNEVKEFMAAFPMPQF